MRKIYFYYLTITMLSFAHVKAQQEAKITVKGDKHKQSTDNDISITQQGNDTIQKAIVEVEKASKNKLKVNQEKVKIDTSNISKTPIKQENSIVEWAKNTENVFTALISVATFIGLARGGYNVIKKRKK